MFEDFFSVHILTTTNMFKYIASFFSAHSLLFFSFLFFSPLDSKLILTIQSQFSTMRFLFLRLISRPVLHSNRTVLGLNPAFIGSFLRKRPAHCGCLVYVS